MVVMNECGVAFLYHWVARRQTSGIRNIRSWGRRGEGGSNSKTLKAFSISSTVQYLPTTPAIAPVIRSDGEGKKGRAEA